MLSRDAQIPDIIVLTRRKYEDDRGFYSETFNVRGFGEEGVTVPFVQDNHIYTRRRWTIRGLHFQIAPHAQDKLVRVVRGSILDVAVDLRAGSGTFGRHVSIVLSDREWNQVFVPKGFAHGFCTLEDDTEVIYKVSNYYAPAHERGLLWCDPALGIAWPMAEGEAIVSAKDRDQPTLDTLSVCFEPA